MAADEPNPEDLEIADELIAERRALKRPGETPEDMTSWQRPITAAIDVINYRAGQLIALSDRAADCGRRLRGFLRGTPSSILQNAGLRVTLLNRIGLGPTLCRPMTSAA